MKKISLALGLSALVLLSACEKKSSDAVAPETTVSSDVFKVVTPTKEQAANPAHGGEEWFAYGAVGGTTKGIAISGIANAQYFKDGTFAINVHINAPVPQKGTHYDAWVSNGSSIVHMGTFISPTSDVRMGLSSEVKKDLRNSSTFLVTLEKDTNPATQGTVVGKGTLKYYKR